MHDSSLEPTVIGDIACYAPELAYQNSDFPENTFESLYQSEAGSFWFRGRQRIIEHFIQKFMKEQSVRFLEVGCGTGFVLKGLSRFKNFRLMGAELHLAGLKWAVTRLPGIDLVQLDATRLPFENRFEGIGAFDVIEHIDEDIAVLSNFHRALTSRGFLFLTVPQHRCLWSQADEISFHKRRYTRRELIQKLRQTGFEVRFISSFVFSLFPAMYLSRYLHRKKKKISAGHIYELNLPPFLDFLGESFMRLEEKFLFHGVSLPWGGSLIVVAQKIDRERSFLAADI